MTDRQLATERAQVVLLEDLADEPESALRDDVPALVSGGNSSRFLAAVLERVEREVRQACDITTGSVDSKPYSVNASSRTMRCVNK